MATHSERYNTITTRTTKDDTLKERLDNIARDVELRTGKRTTTNEVCTRALKLYATEYEAKTRENPFTFKLKLS